MVNTFSGWTEAFSTKTETAQITVKKLLQEVVPRFGLPLILGSDNGPAFTAKISKLIAKALQIKWKLHCAYGPQSSGQVERMNRTLKELLTKLSLETGDGWVNLLPAALLRVKCTPYTQGFNPFEILCGRPPPIIPRLGEEALIKISNHDLLQSLQTLQQTFKQIHSAVWQAQATPDGPLGTPYKPGDLVWVKRHHPDSLKPCWQGPYTGILSTPTAIKVAGKRPWIHHTQLKRAFTENSDQCWTVVRPEANQDPLKMT
jgi:hypothetical protein